MNDSYFQFQHLGNDYAQIVKAVNTHLSDVAIPHRIAMLEQRTRESKALIIEIPNLAKRASEWLRQLPIGIISNRIRRLYRENAKRFRPFVVNTSPLSKYGYRTNTVSIQVFRNHPERRKHRPPAVRTVLSFRRPNGRLFFGNRLDGREGRGPGILRPVSLHPGGRNI